MGFSNDGQYMMTFFLRMKEILLVAKPVSAPWKQLWNDHWNTDFNIYNAIYQQ